MSVRTRRLQADYEQMLAAFGSHPYIRIRVAEGHPPERYELDYTVHGLVLGSDGEVHVKREHVAQVVLTLGYPRQAPQCRMLTPVFHPNIAPHAICIGDHWAAGESLADLVARIGQMIAYQSYNTKSPLNGEAARWTDQHAYRLPVDSVDLTIDVTRFPVAGGAAAPSPVAVGAPVAVPQALRPGSVVVVPEGPSSGLTPPAMLAPRCANCGQVLPPGEALHCAQGHELCSRCSLWCPVCGRNRICLACDLGYCEVCRRAVCTECRRTCAGCGKLLCPADAVPAASDGTVRCQACVRGPLPTPPAAAPAASWASPFAPPGAAVPAPPPTPQPYVEVQCGDRADELVLGPEGLLLGRPGGTPPPDIDLSADAAASRAHARLSLEGGVPMVTDLGSTNGTLLNGRRLVPHVPEPLRSGDVVELGRATRVKVHCPAPG